MSAKSIQIISPVDSDKFELKADELKAILLQDEIKDRNICVVSVAGAFRKGKSFLLDIFLRYLYANYVRRNVHDSHWLGADNEPLIGFHWRAGFQRDTTGILMWSDIFLHDYADGGKIAIMLLDTQGSFDSQSTMRSSATVFALSTMVSSVQIYNLSSNLQEDDLQHLQLFTEYGRLALEESASKPFQKLQFLVRDWQFPCEAEYGAVGGQKVLDNYLQTSDEMHNENKSLRQHISSCFTDVACFLMPHPGLEIVRPGFKGCLKDVSEEFKSSLMEFVPMVLSPENVICKEVNGKRLRASDLVYYFQEYMRIFSSEQLPAPKCIYLATAEANHLVAVADAVDAYKKRMSKFSDPSESYQSAEILECEHVKAVEEAFKIYASKPKMGGEDFENRYEKKLEEDLESARAAYLQSNQHKLVTAKVNHLTCLAKCTSLFDELMEAVCNEAEPYLPPPDFERESSAVQEKVLAMFDNQEILGGEEVFQNVRLQLVADLDKRTINFERRNDFKLTHYKGKLWTAHSEAKKLYNEHMENAVRTYLEMEDLQAEHLAATKTSLAHFDTQPKLLPEETIRDFRQELVNEIEKLFTIYKELNRKKESRLTKGFLESKGMYSQLMTRALADPYVESTQLEADHFRSRMATLDKVETMHMFDSLYELGGEKPFNILREKLVEAIDALLTDFQRHNKVKQNNAEQLACTEKDRAKKGYSEKLSKISTWALVDEVLNTHKKAKAEAEIAFQRNVKLMGPRFFDTYLEKLRTEIDSIYKPYSQRANNVELGIQIVGSLALGGLAAIRLRKPF